MPVDGILKNNFTMKFLMGSLLCMDGEIAFEEKFSSSPEH
jgi:hypothetical protein